MFKRLLNQARISLKSQPRYIYALIDPRDDTVRYVGVTRDVYFRLSRHVKDASSVKDSSKMDRKGAWISELERLGLSPELEILETVELEMIEIDADIDTVALEREKYWIHEFLKSGAPLLNIISTSQRKSRPRTDVEDATTLTPFGKARVRARLTIAQLCAEADVSPYVVQKIERDEPVSGPLASRLCRVLSHYLDQPVTYEGLGIRILESRRRKR